MDAPDIVLPDGFRLYFVAETDSTNEQAIGLAKEGAASGALVWSLRQTAGRGRRGRDWISPSGNLYCSVLLRPEMAARDAAQISFLAAVAVCEAIETLSGGMLRPACKWPNDVLLGGRKLCGVLLESASKTDGQLDWLVLGTGVNLAHHPEQTETPATSLAAAGRPVSPAAMLEAYGARLAAWLARWQQEGFAPLRDAWRARAHGMGASVVARLHNETLHGIFAGLDETGALLLRLPSGSVRRISAGEVFFPS